MSDETLSPLIESESCTELSQEGIINLSACGPIRAVRASD